MTLFIGGEILEDKNSKLLGEILRKTGITLAVYGIDVEQLAKGEVEVTYEEMEYLLKDNPITHVLAMNLKEELAASEYICIIIKMEICLLALVIGYIIIIH